VWDAREVAAIVDFCRRHRLVLCSDEIHCDLLLDPLDHTPAAVATDDTADLVITLMSPSKTFNLPGLNFAFAIIAAPELRTRFAAAGRGLLPYPGCFALAAAEAAYRHGGPWLAELLEYLRGNRDLVERFVAKSLPGVRMTHVEATYLAWLDVRGLDLHDAMQACLDAGVALSPGAAFGDPGFLRLNFGCSRDTLQEALRRLQSALA
jgi:cystathionine beta-lyase